MAGAVSAAATLPTLPGEFAQADVPCLVSAPRSKFAINAMLGRHLRLSQLGYASGDFDVDHALRVFRCAATGVHTFEQPCDRGLAHCEVQSVVCPPELITRRETCLLQIPCTAPAVEEGSAGHGWLRARRPPSWQLIAPSGPGYTFSNESHLVRHGTHWLSEDLTAAGRRLHDEYLGSRLDPRYVMVIDAAASRDGGYMPGFPLDVQSGMHLTVRILDRPLEVLEAHLSVLSARFYLSLVLSEDSPLRVHCDRLGWTWAHAVVCVTPESFVSHGVARYDGDYLSARARPRRLYLESMSPHIASSSIAPMTTNGYAGSNFTVELTLIGNDLGHSTGEVLSVTIGQRACEVLFVHPAELTAVCTAVDGWIQGKPSVTTITGGRGWGCARLVACSGAKNCTDTDATSTAATAARLRRARRSLQEAEPPGDLQSLAARFEALGRPDTLVEYDVNGETFSFDVAPAAVPVEETCREVGAVLDEVQALRAAYQLQAEKAHHPYMAALLPFLAGRKGLPSHISQPSPLFWQAAAGDEGAAANAELALRLAQSLLDGGDDGGVVSRCVTAHQTKTQLQVSLLTPAETVAARLRSLYVSTVGFELARPKLCELELLALSRPLKFACIRLSGSASNR